jgi:hypothetical protein
MFVEAPRRDERALISMQPAWTMIGDERHGWARFKALLLHRNWCKSAVVGSCGSPLPSCLLAGPLGNTVLLKSC